MLLCPRCFSHDIHMVIGGFVGQKYACKDCDYVGSFVVETTADEVARLQREARESGAVGEGRDDAPEG